MSCPYYQDFTRECIQYLPRIVDHPDFSICQSSDRYENCLAYVALGSGFRCKHQNDCLENLITKQPFLAKMFIEDERTIAIFKQVAQKYCSSEQNHQDCACFKLWEQGTCPAVDLLPDGRKFRLRDILFKKEIIVE